jgi:outer membrane immunogenic protein
MIRRILLASASALALAGTAFAADLPSRAPPPVYLPPPPTWTGFYIGINAGYEWSASNSVNVTSVPLGALDPAINVFPGPTSLAAAAAGTGALSVNNSGFIGGGQIGYNYQFAPSFVAGIEADFQGIAGSSSRSTLFGSVDALSGVGFPGNFAQALTTVDKKVDYLGTVRGRLGWLLTPTLLIFGDGGLAYGGISSSTGMIGAAVGVNEGLCCGNPVYGSFGHVSNTKVGWTAGGGAEWMFLPNWSAKVEYLYYDLGSVTYSGGVATAFAAPGGVIPVGTSIFSLASHTSTRFNGNVVRAGINYHFNWGGAPVVARY